jgi:pyridoxamine 5'-phosphate oxidase
MTSVMNAPDVPATPDFAKLRRDYMQRSLSEHEVDPDPVKQFLAWLQEAIDAGAMEPNAMTLATCTAAGVPSARIVLLKRVDHDGFAFFTNYLSRKGRELDSNPRASLLFYWPELERQVRIEGGASRTSEDESEAYFTSRPPDARIGSAASAQSDVVASREALELAFAELRQRYPHGNVPRPPHWGGYRVRPQRVEFWQGRPSRLHDRIEYVIDGKGGWTSRRLSP